MVNLVGSCYCRLAEMPNKKKTSPPSDLYFLCCHRVHFRFRRTWGLTTAQNSQKPPFVGLLWHFSGSLITIKFTLYIHFNPKHDENKTKHNNLKNTLPETNLAPASLGFSLCHFPLGFGLLAGHFRLRLGRSTNLGGRAGAELVLAMGEFAPITWQPRQKKGSWIFLRIHGGDP